MSKFKVLIAGGSVTGIALANMLEAYGIDYELLEAYPTIAPQLGASICLFQSGLRIIDQLGLYPTIERLSAPIDSTLSYDPQGKFLGRQDDMSEGMTRSLGYAIRWLDRQALIQTLLEHLENKSKIHVNKRIVHVDLLDSGVEVTTKDGSTFVGNILVGADGIHSLVRQEMWRLANEEQPGYIPEEERTAVQCTYRCIFGISTPMTAVKEGENIRVFKEHRSHFIQGGPGGRIYWFFLSNIGTVHAPDIPRYSSEDEARLVEKYSNDALINDFTFGDLYKGRIRSALVPLEEYVFKKWSFRRIITIGDSAHKLHPLTGLGGNCALESAAGLANFLTDVLQTNSNPSDATLQAGFQNLQDTQHQRYEQFMKASHAMQRIHALETTFMKFMAFNVLAKSTTGHALTRIAVGMNPALRLRYLPTPSKPRMVAYGDELAMKPDRRKVSTVKTALSSIIFCLFANFFLPRYTGDHGMAASLPNASIPWPIHLYTTIFSASLITLWAVESYRQAFILTPLYSAIPWTLAAHFFSIEVIAPIYFAVYVRYSQPKPFYYPTPRALPVNVAKALPIGFVFAYGIPAVFSLSGSETRNGLSLWPMAHLCLPVFVWICSIVIKTVSTVPASPVALFGTSDIPYLRGTYSLVFMTAGIIHIAQMLSLLADLRSRSHWLYPNYPVSAPFISLLASTVIWCLFTVWDLRRVKATGVSMGRALLYILGCSVLFGPGATLAATWYWREVELERARNTRVDSFQKLARFKD